jgi:ABC-type nitrate/sulfonate/bicarbonate transport system permease component
MQAGQAGGDNGDSAAGIASYSRGLGRASGFLLVIGVLCLWEASARSGLIKSENWPPLTSVVAALAREIWSGRLPGLLLATLHHSLAGFVIGSLLGVVVGLAMAGSRWAYASLEPLVELCRPIPIPAIIPTLILLLGIGDTLKIFCGAFAVFFPVAINTMHGVAAVPDSIREMAKTFQRGPADILARVVLPSALPFITAGMRVALALSLIVAIAAEMVSGSSGLGYQLLTMQYAMRPEDMYAAVLLLAIVGYAMNRLFVAVERRLLPWYYAEPV